MRAKRVALSPHAQHTHAQHWTQGLGAHGKALKQKLADQGWHLGASTTVNFVQTLSTLLIDEHTLQHMHARLSSNHSEHAPCSQEHTNKHTHALPRTSHSEHVPCAYKNTQTSTCIHHLAAITVSMRLVHNDTQKSMSMHFPIAIAVTMCLVQVQRHTPIHACICFAAITVTIRLVHTKTQTPTRACICFAACALYKPKHSLTHVCITLQQSP
jgi:hypothetical protein